MPDEAKNLQYGDLIVLELALLFYLKEIDLSLQSGQFASELIGKLEYQLSDIRAAANAHLGTALPDEKMENKKENFKKPVGKRFWKRKRFFWIPGN